MIHEERTSVENKRFIWMVRDYTFGGDDFRSGIRFLILTFKCLLNL